MTTTYYPETPQAVTRSHRDSTIMGTVSLALSLTVLAVATAAHVGSASVTGFAGLIVLTTSTVTALFGMKLPAQHTRLNSDGQPIEPMYNWPGSQWFYYEIGSGRINQHQIIKPGRNYTQISVWRSCRQPVIVLSVVLLGVGSVIVGLVALAHNLVAF